MFIQNLGLGGVSLFSIVPDDKANQILSGTSRCARPQVARAIKLDTHFLLLLGGTSAHQGALNIKHRLPCQKQNKLLTFAIRALEGNLEAETYLSFGTH